MILYWMLPFVMTAWNLTLNREVMWVSLDERVFEHLRLVSDHDGILAEGLIIHLDTKESFRLRYRIHCDLQWQVRSLKLENLDQPPQLLVLQSDGNGNWTNAQGEVISSLKGCRDVDIYYSPFTNTLAIRRLGLKPNESTEINVAFINAVDMKVNAVRQRYTLLQATPNGGLYRYESLTSGFATELPVDSDGLVLDYPNFFRRAWAR